MASGSCRNERDAHQFLRHSFLVFEAIGHGTERESLDCCKGCGLRLSIGHHPWQRRYLADPPAVRFLFQFDPQLRHLGHIGFPSCMTGIRLSLH